MPPIDETPEERAHRLAEEAEALRISRQIDEQISRERSLRKKKKVVRLLLLGQSESGTSISIIRRTWVFCVSPRIVFMRCRAKSYTRAMDVNPCDCVAVTGPLSVKTARKTLFPPARHAHETAHAVSP